MKKIILKNILVFTLILGVLAPSLGPAMAISPKGLIGGFVTQPKKAAADAANITFLTALIAPMEALVLVCDTESLLLGTAPIPYPAGFCEQTSNQYRAFVSNVVNTTAKEKLTLLQRILDFLDELAYQLFKRVIMDRLVDAFVQWIQRGGQGTIIEDWGQFLDDSANVAAGEFVRGIGAGFLCSPFNLQVQLALLPVEQFSKVSCTLDQIIGNINSFLDDFRNGSWIAYQEQWYPRNNFYGGAIIAMDEFWRTQAEAKRNAENEGAASQGFLSWTVEECIASPTGSYVDSRCSQFAPAGYAGGARYAKVKRVKTPGSVTAAAVTQTSIVLPLTRLIHSEDLTAYITQIINASVNVLTKEGIKWLANTASRNVPPPLSKQFPCAGLTGAAFSACQASVNAERSSFTATQNAILGTTVGSLTTRGQLASTLQQSIDLQTEYIEALTLLVESGLADDRRNELFNEEQLLEDLIGQQESNQSFIEAMVAQATQIEGAAVPENGAVLEDDYLNLSGSISLDYTDDEVIASQQLINAEAQLSEIKSKVESQLPTILLLLPPSLRPGSTSATTTP